MKHRLLLAFIPIPFLTILLNAELLLADSLPEMKPGPANVGFTILKIPRAAEKADPPPMAVALWYPTESPTTTYLYNDPYKTSAPLALETRPAPGPHPLIIYSHGYGGAGIASAYLAEYWASQGFIVAAPDHEDKNVIVRTVPGTPLRDKWYSYNVIKLARSGKKFNHAAQAHRNRDVKLLLDEMLRQNQTEGSPLKDTINPNAIGIAGHSLGGYTALCVCGVREEAKDPRIKAALLLSGGVFMFKAEDYARLRVPVMFMFGEVETARWRSILLNDKLADTRRAYDHCAPPKYMIEIKDCNHFSFSQAIFDPKWPGLGEKKAKPVSETIKIYTLAFFRRWLQNDLSTQKVLHTTSPMFVIYHKQD